MTYFNGKYMAFIACVIRPGKTGIICKIHFIDDVLTATLTIFLFTHRK